MSTTGPLRGPRQYECACPECGSTRCAGPRGEHSRLVALEDAVLRLVALLRSAGVHEAECAVAAYRRDYDRNRQAAIFVGSMPAMPECDCIVSTQTEIPVERQAGCPACALDHRSVPPDAAFVHGVACGEAGRAGLMCDRHLGRLKEVMR